MQHSPVGCCSQASIPVICFSHQVFRLHYMQKFSKCAFLKNSASPPVSFTSVSWLKKILKEKKKGLLSHIPYVLYGAETWWLRYDFIMKNPLRKYADVLWKDTDTLCFICRKGMNIFSFLVAKNIKMKNRILSLVKLLRKCPSGGWTMHMLKWYSAMHSPKIWKRWLSLMISLCQFFSAVKSVAFWFWNECCS